MNDTQLDDLLNASLTPVPDDGFSGRVMVRARRERLKEKAPFYAALLVCAAAVLFYAPLPQITAAILPVLVLAVSPAVSLAIAVLVLTFTAERALAQR